MPDLNEWLEKAAGDRGGVIVGYTSSGKPVYQSALDQRDAAAKQHIAAQDATAAKQSAAKDKVDAAQAALDKLPGKKVKERPSGYEPGHQPGGPAPRTLTHEAAKQMADASHANAMASPSHAAHTQAAADHDKLANVAPHPKLKENAKRIADKHRALAATYKKSEVDMTGLNDWLEKAAKETPFHSPDEEHQVAAHKDADKSPGADMMDKGCGDKMAKMEGSDKPEEQKDVAANEDAPEDEGDEAEGGEEDEGGDDEKVEKSAALSEWLQKAMPGTADEGQGSPAKGLPSGVPAGMDERKDQGSKPAEVARAEDGGQLAGVGATSGASDDGPASVQSTTKAAGPGKTDQFTADDPEDTDEMKDKLGMIEVPGAPAGAYGAMQAKTSRAGRAYGDATKPMEGMGDQAAKPASSPTTGASGMGHAKVQKGLDSNTFVVPLEDQGVRALQKSHAQRLAEIRKGEEQIQGFALPPD